MGLALGGAQYKFYNDLGNSRSYIPFSPYLGHNIETEPVEDILKNSGLNYIKSENITEDASQFIADGKIVAWVQGKEEFGPRALGNRSILVSPLISSMKDDLNLRVKHRESIRPFAGAIPVENCNKYFEIEKESPHMLLIAQVREEFKELLRPIVHVDGSIRLQTVTEQMNSKFYNLLKSFGAKTGTPVILNTSLNDNGEPIVSTVEDAIVFFRKNSIDYLIISNFIITNPV
jgi:carbamoyltransferase